MENKNLKFKTNINCSSCVAAVTPFLEAEGVSHWQVDTANREKILTVESEGTTEQEIILAVEKAGFKIETLTT